jgi:cell division protein FtsI (penicillin-binding protein 3)
MAAALEEGIAEESDIIDCEKGAYVVGDRIIHEAHNGRFEKLTLREVLKRSSNIGSVKIAERLGKEKFFDYLERFGFGSKTDIDLPGEIQGIVRNVDDWTDVDLATIAFGQGVSVTAIQLITAVSAIANHGVLMKPHIVRGMIDKDGQVIKEFKPTVVRKVVSPVTSERIRSMMTDVVEDGTGKRARMADITVAGKTGTSQKFDFSKGVYSSQKVITSFIGFLPADDPHLSIFVMLDEPKTQKWGGEAAAPVFRNISEQILRCFNRAMEPRETIVEKNQDNVEFVQVSTYAEFSRQEKSNDSVIPDFRGMSMRQVLHISRGMGIEVKVSGSGWAVKQDPAPGSSVGRHQFCRVFFGQGF